jgi:hypothetical protein
MTTKLTLEDLEAMRQHYGIAQREAQREQIPGARGTYALLEDLEGGRLQEVGISWQRWALLRGVSRRLSGP